MTMTTLTLPEFRAKYPEAIFQPFCVPSLPPCITEERFLKEATKFIHRPLLSKELREYKKRYTKLVAEYRQRVQEMRRDWYNLYTPGEETNSNMVLEREFPEPQPYDEWGPLSWCGEIRHRSVQERLADYYKMVAAYN